MLNHTKNLSRAEIDARLKSDARARLDRVAILKKGRVHPERAHNPTAAKRLAARIADWDNTMKSSKNTTGYNKPGSMKLM